MKPIIYIQLAILVCVFYLLCEALYRRTFSHSKVKMTGVWMSLFSIIYTMTLVVFYLCGVCLHGSYSWIGFLTYQMGIVLILAGRIWGKPLGGASCSLP